MVRLAVVEAGTGILAVAVLASFFAPIVLAAGLALLGIVVTLYGFRSDADGDR